MRNIHPSAVIDPNAELAEDVEIGPFSIIGPHVKIGAGTRVVASVFLDGWTTIGGGCVIYPFASIGSQTQDLKFKGGRTFVEIGDRTTIREYVTVNSGTEEGDKTIVGSNCLIMAYSHVAHTCRLGDSVIMANGGTLAGHVIVEDSVVLGGLCGVHQFVRIGRMSIIGGCSKLTQDVPPFMMVDGNPAQVRGINAVGLKRRNVSSESQLALKRAYKFLYRQNLSTSQALDKIRAEVEMTPEVQYLAAFVEASERGIVK